MTQTLKWINPLLLITALFSSYCRAQSFPAASAPPPKFHSALDQTPPSGTNSSPQIAFTFDDFPAHGPLPPGETRLGIINKIIAALQAGDVPPTYGFLNAKLLADLPADASVLEAWRRAGFLLGNHAWSHMDLNKHSPAEFEADVERNESALTKWMKDADWHWFRYPYLSEGDTAEKRQMIRDYLAKRGYKIATVTISFGDYQWTEPYARCMAEGDEGSLKILKDGYIAAADETAAYERKVSHALYGRDVPYVLLMHIGAATADMLPRLIELYRSRGFQFISLEQAEKDEFYRSSMDPSLPPTPDSLEAMAKERNLTLPPRPTSTLPFATICK